MDRDFDYTKELLSKRSSQKSDGPSIWCFASGKGGVGKTFACSSAALTLTKLGHSVIAIDFDISGSNLHTSFGFDPSHLNLRHFFEGTKQLSEIVIPTKYQRLSYVQGFWDSWSPIELSSEQIESFMKSVRKLKADYILIDLGAGTQLNYLDVLYGADEKILVSTPEPTSIEKTYRTIEAYICHSIKKNSTQEAYEKMVTELRNYRQKTNSTFFSFRKYLKNNPEIQIDFFHQLETSPLRLIVNNCRTDQNTELGYSIKSVCNKFYDLSLDYMGSIDYDGAVWQAVSTRNLTLDINPFSPLAGQFLSLCKHLIDPKELRAVS